MIEALLLMAQMEEPFCDMREFIMARLLSHNPEMTIVAQGKQANGITVEILGDQSDGSWYLLLSEGETACVAGYGTQLRLPLDRNYQRELLQGDQP